MCVCIGKKEICYEFIYNFLKNNNNKKNKAHTCVLILCRNILIYTKKHTKEKKQATTYTEWLSEKEKRAQHKNHDYIYALSF